MKLSTYLSQRGLSHRRFADQAGIAHTTIMRLLKHGSLPRGSTAAQIAAATGGAVTAADIVAEAGAIRSDRLAS